MCKLILPKWNGLFNARYFYNHFDVCAQLTSSELRYLVVSDLCAVYFGVPSTNQKISTNYSPYA